MGHRKSTALCYVAPGAAGGAADTLLQGYEAAPYASEGETALFVALAKTLLVCRCALGVTELGSAAGPACPGRLLHMRCRHDPIAGDALAAARQTVHVNSTQPLVIRWVQVALCSTGPDVCGREGRKEHAAE